MVKPGENIQKAIEKAPEHPDKLFVILVKNGAYRQKVIIDKPNIVLLGENRDSVRIIYPEDITSQWAFDGQWDTEAKIRELWPT